MVFFSGGKGGGEEVDYGYKGKGVTNHLLVEKAGNPIALTTTSANKDERKEVLPLFRKVGVHLRKYKNQGKIPIVEMDKGYDSSSLRLEVMSLGIFLWISRRKTQKQKEEKMNVYLEKERWMVERTIAWLQRKFRRIVCRWERKSLFWRGFLQAALVLFWTTKISRFVN